MWGILTLLAELSMGNSHPVCSSVCVCVYILYGLIIASIILSVAVELIQLWGPHLKLCCVKAIVPGLFSDKLSPIPGPLTEEPVTWVSHSFFVAQCLRL